MSKINCVASRFNSFLCVLVSGGLMAVAGTGPSLGHEKHLHNENRPVSDAASHAACARVSIADVTLLNRNGRPVRLKSDVLAGAVVAVNFIFTTCTTICPITSSIFAEVKENLGNWLGKQVRLVSISIDPRRDSPKRMDRTARKYGAGPGWYWLTGSKSDIDKVLLGMGVYTPDFVNHPPLILIGDIATGRWVRLSGFAAPDLITRQIEMLMSATGTKEKTGLKGD